MAPGYFGHAGTAFKVVYIAVWSHRGKPGFQVWMATKQALAFPFPRSHPQPPSPIAVIYRQGRLGVVQPLTYDTPRHRYHESPFTLSHWNYSNTLLWANLPLAIERKEKERREWEETWLQSVTRTSGLSPSEVHCS